MTAFSHSLSLVVAQLAIGIGALAALALTPPANGAMLLVPLVGDAPAVQLARDSEALLLARGPGGGVVVRGERRALFWPLLRAGVLTVAAPASLCGKAA